MNSCDFRVFLQEFGTTVHLSLPGSVSEKERLLLKLLMQGMSVTEMFLPPYFQTGVVS